MSFTIMQTELKFKRNALVIVVTSLTSLPILKVFIKLVPIESEFCFVSEKSGEKNRTENLQNKFRWRLKLNRICIFGENFGIRSFEEVSLVCYFFKAILGNL